MNLLKVSLAVLLGLASVIYADDKADASTGERADKSDELKTILLQRLPSMNVEYIAPSPVPGMYEVMASGQLIYVTEDGNYLMNGRLFGISNGIENLSQAALDKIDAMKAPIRKARLAEVDEGDMIIFKAPQEKYQISVFTDVDCGYCRQLHREIPKYHDLGITVKYLGYPRAGIGSPSHAKLRSVWCAKDQLGAMDNAKLKREFGSDTCDDPLVEHMKMVRSFGITGTPAIILDSGKLLPGFVEAPNLLKMLEKDAADQEQMKKESVSGL